MERGTGPGTQRVRTQETKWVCPCRAPWWVTVAPSVPATRWVHMFPGLHGWGNGLPVAAAQATAGGQHPGVQKCISCVCSSHGGVEDTGARLLAAREPVPPVKRRVRAVGQRLHGGAHQFPPAFLSVLLAEAHTQGRNLRRFPIAYECFTPGQWRSRSL